MLRMLARSACWRKSLDVSTRIVFPACSIRIDTRSRLSRGSSDMHVSQSHAIDGTPVEVPVPRNVSRIQLTEFREFSEFFRRY